jgi:hypothetical protein
MTSAKYEETKKECNAKCEKAQGTLRYVILCGDHNTILKNPRLYVASRVRTKGL